MNRSAEAFDNRHSTIGNYRSARDPPELVESVIPPSPVGYGGQAEPWLDDPFPDYDNEPVFAEN